MFQEDEGVYLHVISMDTAASRKVAQDVIENMFWNPPKHAFVGISAVF